ncbi:methyl-accepting chemotaxis protein [Undibacterium sp. Di24W]|uniref:methyl-accepting chemotaxis protein n=1 Tax=Undibacterium sp. Di24W TaxID=3413033 RepID=UPI003BF43ABF
MSKIVRVSPAMKEFLAAPKSAEMDASDFYTNPIWRLGVSIMAKMKFRTKAALILLLLALPLSTVSWYFYSDQITQISFAKKERIGIAYNREIFPVMDLAQQFRRDSLAASVDPSAASAATATKEKLQAALTKLEATHQQLGGVLGVDKDYAATRSAFEKTNNATGAPDIFQVHSDFIASLITLMTNVADNSNLTLDPEVDSYYLMDAAFLRLPDILEYSGKLRGTGNAVLKSGEISPAQQKSLNKWIPVAEFQFRNLNDSLTKASVGSSNLKSKLNFNEVVKEGNEFYDFALKNVIDTQVFGAETQSKFITLANTTIKDLYLLTSRVIQELDQTIEQRIKASERHLYLISALILVSVLLALYFFYSFFLVVDGGFKLMRVHLGEVAQGDLRNIPGKPFGSDETAEVLHDLQQTYNALHELIRTVRHSARALHATSAEIATASLDLSARTEAAAASLEEQAAAMEEIGATVGQSADKAALAAKFAGENAQVAESGGKIIHSVVQTMENIHNSSHKISDIIGVIDGIAFQTNILALNAAVEAARAGESGRGFAVVASEVRTLAHRSADAAREIKDLISASVGQIASGSAVVQQAGVTMNTMVTNAKQISMFLSDISVGAREQATGVAQVGISISELDENTQSNAALVEETSAASGALTQQAEVLQEEIAHFRVV